MNPQKYFGWLYSPSMSTQPIIAVQINSRRQESYAGDY